MKTKVLILLILISICLALQSDTYAQERTVSISPPKIETEIGPNGYYEGAIKVKNQSQVPVRFSASLMDFVVKDSLGTPILIPDENLSGRYSGRSWVSVFPEVFDLAPNSDQTVYFSILVPQNAVPGGHYTSIVFKPEVLQNEDNSSASVSTGIGSLLYINVPGEIREEAKITNFSANNFSEYGPIEIKTVIQNLSDIHISPQGKVKITDFRGNVVYEEALTEQNIFPETSREYKNRLGEKYMIGPYKASVLLSYGQKNNLPLTEELTFWVFPWKIALIAILGLVLMVLLVVYLRKRGQNEDTELPKAPIQNL